MADPSKSTTSFSFSQAARSDSGAGLSGQPTSSAPVTGNPFGSATTVPAKTKGGLFGNTSASTGPSGTSFGAGAGAGGSPAVSSPFGGAGDRSITFGSVNKAVTGGGFHFEPSTNRNNASGGVFGSSQPNSQSGMPAASAPSGSLFSTPKRLADTPVVTQPASNPFGGNLGGGGLFGSKAESKDVNITPTSKQTTSLFGNSTTPAGPPPGTSTVASSGSLFSFDKPDGQSNAPSGNIFGGLGKTVGNSSSNMPSTPSLFAPSSGPAADANKMQGSQAQSESTNFFGAPPKPANSGTGLFDMTPPASQTESKSSLFNTTSQPPAIAAANPAENKPTPSFFPNLGSSSTSNSQPASSSSAPSLFLNTSRQPSSTPSFSFAQSSETTAAPSGMVKSPTAAPGSSLFGNLGASNTATSSGVSAPSPAAPKTSFFPSVGQPQSKSADTTNTSVQSSGAPSSSAPDIFGNTGKASTPSATVQSQGATTAAPIGANNTNSSNLGASTAGPTPPARSRLKDKTMDDIITRWASDLSKYQKDFQAQAEKVAAWDRMLVENSEKIQRLYGSTLEAERATTEVERQLTSVESDQAELESWLTHYEAEVDNMIQNQVGQGEGLSGPDQERERTYQLATKLSDRLDEMGKDLGCMIEEINDASSNLSKHSKSDDPLTQVVRVLNSHLTQLQQIDQGAARLQLKVKEAQRMGQRMGPPNGLNGPSSEAAEGFYRSYMGRG